MKTLIPLALTRRLAPPASMRVALQISMMVAIWFAASELTRVTGLGMSPGVVGLLAVLALLLSGRGNVVWFRDGANWLLGELVLFFIPCVVAVMQYGQLFRTQGVQIVIAVVVGTVLVMAATALAVHVGCRLERWIAARRGQES
ncbi:CidA/LrgA family protein [Cupriavidus pauculus]|uniref:CidA/LrgA family protein n=1 Tax=Cupriavidus pauculus TaxID=82633 RepID=A0A5P2H268_9BURK|nr:CidA/LrgA family protein [Cupriavidus pauculus]QET01430.1 CidA/LrgA family protein [Cupriavidus pauculus]